MQISFAVTVKLISAFVFTTRIVQFLYFLNPKFQASKHLQLHRPICGRPGQKPRRPAHMIFYGLVGLRVKIPAITWQYGDTAKVKTCLLSPDVRLLSMEAGVSNDCCTILHIEMSGFLKR